MLKPILTFAFALTFPMLDLAQAQLQLDGSSVFREHFDYPDTVPGFQPTTSNTSGIYGTARPVVIGNMGRMTTTVERQARETGIAGHWIVESSLKDGSFSTAQIGQQPGDIISIFANPNVGSLLSLG